MTRDKLHKQHSQPRKRPLHTDWRAWTVVALMLAAMAAYILSLDESIGPRIDSHAVPAADVGE